MLTNTDCTLYNAYKNPDTGKMEYRRTHLAAVFWDETEAANARTGGLSNADNLSLYIPKSVDAEGKTYIQPDDYASLPPSEVDTHWTIFKGKDYVMKGDGPDIADEEGLKEIAFRQDCFKVMKVDSRMYGSERMRHWEVSGR